VKQTNARSRGAGLADHRLKREDGGGVVEGGAVHLEGDGLDGEEFRDYTKSACNQFLHLDL